MKKLALAAISLLLAGSASAADLRRPAPVKAPAPVPVAVYNWTGCYVGAGGGYGMCESGDPDISPAAVAFGLSNDNGGRGWFGTVQVGCDYQIGSNIVIGAFGDYDFSGIKGDMAVRLRRDCRRGEAQESPGRRAAGSAGFRSSSCWSSCRAATRRRGSARSTSSVAFTGAPTNRLSIRKHTYSGWFLGSGYEYGIGWLPGLFWKTEYRFADYGIRPSCRYLLTGAPTGRFPSTAHKRVHTVRSELVWRFNWSGPAAAYAADVRPLPVKAPAPVVAYNWTGCYLGAGGGYGMYNQETQQV